MTQEMAAETTSTEGAIPATTAGSHAERLASLYPSGAISISREEGLMLYQDMVLGRRFEDKCAEMYYRGKMFGFVHLYNGQEAVST
ncbi:MAG: pyruvate dehydrogenase (acetyl-transferring) E1 component subunit alpha, partial [Prochlorococcaceae cyanobacterium]